MRMRSALVVCARSIAERFYVSPSRAVRGTFVYEANGAAIWRNTESERAGFRVVPGWLCFGREVGRRVRRWRPDGHTAFTPLWRLDKIIAFPYLDEPRMHRLSEATGQRQERAQVEGLVLGAQGPLGAPTVTAADHVQARRLLVVGTRAARSKQPPGNAQGEPACAWPPMRC